MKTVYLVRLVGCDDETEINIALSESELEFVKRLSEYSKEISRCNCMPRIVVEKFDINNLGEGKVY